MAWQMKNPNTAALISAKTVIKLCMKKKDISARLVDAEFATIAGRSIVANSKMRRADMGIVDGCFNARCMICGLAEADFCHVCKAPNGCSADHWCDGGAHKWICETCFVNMVMSKQEAAYAWAKSHECALCGRKSERILDWCYRHFYCTDRQDWDDCAWCAKKESSNDSAM